MPYYAVKRGRRPGVYATWAEAKAQIDGFAGPVFRKFETREEATDFIGGQKQLDIASFFTIEPREPPSEGENALICFTDGSAINNGKANAKAGYGVAWPYRPELDCCAPVEPATNNRAEYCAVLRALEQADELDPERKKTLIVYTDSQLLINSVTKWLPGWRRAGYKKADGSPVANIDLVKKLEATTASRKTAFRHVRAHTGAATWEAQHNDRVDKLAKSAVAAQLAKN